MSEARDRTGLEDYPLPDLLALLRLDDSDTRSSAAATEILRRFQPLLRKYWAGHPVGDYGDFVQEAMVRLLIAIPKLRDPAAFPGLFRRIVIGTAADAITSRGKEGSLEDINESDLALHFDQDISTGVVVRSFLELLSGREREVIELSYFHDLAPADIALRMNVTEGAVRMTKSRAIRRMRTEMVQSTKKDGGR